MLANCIKYNGDNSDYGKVSRSRLSFSAVLIDCKWLKDRWHYVQFLFAVSMYLYRYLYFHNLSVFSYLFCYSFHK